MQGSISAHTCAYVGVYAINFKIGKKDFTLLKRFK